MARCFNNIKSIASNAYRISFPQPGFITQYFDSGKSEKILIAIYMVEMMMRIDDKFQGQAFGIYVSLYPGKPDSVKQTAAARVDDRGFAVIRYQVAKVFQEAACVKLHYSHYFP